MINKRKFRKANKGFSIVEILISVAIICAAITTIAVKSIDFPERSENGSITLESNSDLTEIYESDMIQIQEESELIARQTELRIIQTAMDTMMIRKQLDTVSKSFYSSDMSNFPKDNGLYPEYLRINETKYEYSCNENGQISQR